MVRELNIMFDPLTVLLIGGGILAYREINKKDYGVLTPSRDERYRNSMEYCHQPELLLEEAKMFQEYGLKAQASMLKLRAKWRARTPELKQAHEEVYQKAIKSKNIPGILEVAAAFEDWTATKKAANLREHVRVLQETMVQDAAQKAAQSVETPNTAKKSNGIKTAEPFTGVIDVPVETINDNV